MPAVKLIPLARATVVKRLSSLRLAAFMLFWCAHKSKRLFEEKLQRAGPAGKGERGILGRGLSTEDGDACTARVLSDQKGNGFVV